MKANIKIIYKQIYDYLKGTRANLKILSKSKKKRYTKTVPLKKHRK